MMMQARCLCVTFLQLMSWFASRPGPLPHVPHALPTGSLPRITQGEDAAATRLARQGKFYAWLPDWLDPAPECTPANMAIAEALGATLDTTAPAFDDACDEGEVDAGSEGRDEVWQGKGAFSAAGVTAGQECRGILQKRLSVEK